MNKLVESSKGMIKSKALAFFKNGLINQRRQNFFILQQISKQQNFLRIAQFNFSTKVGKKKQEKLEKQKEKETRETPQGTIDLTPVEESMKGQLEHTKAELAKLKTGRLTPDLFEKLFVVAYGEKTPLTELCQMVSKAVTTVQLNIYDDALVGAIHKILENSDLNLQLKREGKIITCTMVGGNTKEIKDATIKAAKSVVDKAKNLLRKHRQTGLDMIKGYKKFESEDFIKEAEKEVDNIHNKFVAELDNILKSKEKEIMSS
ncbi:hypothetical protein ABPG72_009275 [Tetrahymena utriculariae]